MLITFEGEVPQRSDASQNDHKSKGYPSKTSEAAFTMQKADKGALKKNSDCAALIATNGFGDQKLSYNHIFNGNGGYENF